MKFRILERVKQQWFLAGLFLSIFLAKEVPWLGATNGPLKPEITVKMVGVFVIFFISGISLKTAEFKKAFFQWKLHLFVQTFTFLVVPALTAVSSPLLSHFLPDEVLLGLSVLSCMPPPVSSAVILTKASNGNEAAAVFNSALGSVLGVFLTPVLLTRFAGISSAVPASKIVLKLSATVINPLVLGQAVRKWRKSAKHPPQWLSKCSQVILLMIIFTTFCDAFIGHENGGSDDLELKLILSVILLVFVVQVILTSTLFNLSRKTFKRHFSPSDSMCVVFCGVHKSLTLGIPILGILYEGSPDLQTICLPLLIYHPMQIAFGGLLAPYFRNYVRRKTSFSTNKDIPI